MLDQLRSSLGAFFFVRRSRITKKAIHALFDDLLADARMPSRPVFRVERETSGDARYSGLCFSHDRPVPFLKDSARMDRVHGFILIVEVGAWVAVLRTGLDLTASFRRAHLESVDRAKVEHAIARHDSVFERLSLRNMTMSRLALVSKTVESHDLDNVVAATSAGRLIPRAYRVRRDDGSYSATPGTGRISMRSDRADVDGAIDWVRRIVGLLDGQAVTSPFIERFARPVDLSGLAGGTFPTWFAVDTMKLADEIWEDEDRIRLVREDGGAWVELARAEVDTVLAALNVDLKVGAADEGGVTELRDPAGATKGALKFNKSRISLRRLDLPQVAGVFVENAALGVGADPDRSTLERHLDAADMFVVLFSDLALAWIDGSLFRDEDLVGGGDVFMRHLIAEPALAGNTSEKGSFAAGQTQFSPGSVFRTVVDVVAVEDVLLCDDLDDEWADFIGVASTTRPPTITFYHAKYGSQSLGASPFHDAVGQGIKNLGRLALAGGRMPKKHSGWDAFYANGKVVTAIPRRVRGGTRAEVAIKMANATGAPDVQRRVVIVTSSLSRAAVEATFAAARAGQAPQPSFVQLYWILAGFFSACSEVGAIGLVVCRP